MDLLHNLALGFSVLADPMTIVYSLIGVVCGVIIGALPGLGPSVGIAVLLPMCYGLDPACALCMLCGIYYGAMYGGSITSILINTPGDSAAIMTTLDGYPMARQGKAGKALGMSCLASVIGGDDICGVVHVSGTCGIQFCYKVRAVRIFRPDGAGAYLYCGHDREISCKGFFGCVYRPVCGGDRD